jgi:uncharacterized protein YdeI (YjbR/CyaY-like superfamily)
MKRFATAASWESWLSKHERAKGLWIQIAKKGTAVRSVTYDEALDVALCHGWIDGRARGLDETYYLVRFTPRRPKGLWSQRNVAKVEKLIADGRMKPAGLREVEAARTEGRWDAAYGKDMAVPDDLARALVKNKKAKAFFDRLDASNRTACSMQVITAKRPETRAARIEKLVTMLARGEKLL